MKKINKKILLAKEYKIAHPEMSITAVADIYKIDRHVLSKHLKEDYSNLHQVNIGDYVYLFEQNEWDALEQYKQTGRAIECYTQHGVARNTFYSWIKLLDLEKYKQYTHSFNRNAFKTIQTEEDAYWLGFITANGYINEDRGFLNIKLQASDETHLKKFLNYMQANDTEIKDDYGGSNQIVKSITLNSRDLVNNLIQYGLFQGKSGKERFYDLLPIELVKHYIRGIVDGDGCLHDGERRVFDICGNFDLLTKICEYINNHIIDISLDKYTRIYTHGSIYKLCLRAKEHVLACYKHFYENSNIYLDRKFNFAMQQIRSMAVNKSEKKTGTDTK